MRLFLCARASVYANEVFLSLILADVICFRFLSVFLSLQLYASRTTHIFPSLGPHVPCYIARRLSFFFLFFVFPFLAFFLFFLPSFFLSLFLSFFLSLINRLLSDTPGQRIGFSHAYVMCELLPRGSRLYFVPRAHGSALHKQVPRRRISRKEVRILFKRDIVHPHGLT